MNQGSENSGRRVSDLFRNLGDRRMIRIFRFLNTLNIAIAFLFAVAFEGRLDRRKNRRRLS
jgi:hypothetical protein